MSRRYRVLSIALLLLGLSIASLAIVLSHDSACVAAVPLPGDVVRMNALVSRCYGPPHALTVEAIAKPVPADDEVLVKVHAAGLNPLDWHFARGKPYIMRLGSGLGAPEDSRVGVDFAGTVEAVGRSVTRFKPGDAVFGGRSGALAEYVPIREDRAIVLKPANVTFEQAAGVPIAALTALQGLRDKGGIKAGQKVLINGASGGVGTFAVQIAKSFGADVTGVCSTRNVALVRSIGADRVIDYQHEDFTQGAERYDLILDNVGNRSLSEYRRVLKPHGALVMIGGSIQDPWIGPFLLPIKAMLLSPFVSQKLVMFISELNQPDMEFLSGLMRDGKLKTVIDRRYPLNEAAAGIAYVEQGRARGKVVVVME